MNTHDERRLVEALTSLAEILGEAVTPGRIAGYVLALDDLDAADLVAAIGAWAREERFFPKPCELRCGARLIRWKRELSVKAAIKEAEANAKAGRIMSPEDAALVAERDALEAARIAEFKRNYPGVMEAPPPERFGRWLAHARRRLMFRAMPGGRA
jgi:hypothetical protein